MEFTHLHVHTEYSLLDGSAKIEPLLERAKELGMKSLAITDHGVMYGVIDFYKTAVELGIKPIIGCEVYVAPNSRFDREVVKGEDRYYHLILLAKNNEGYQNLIKIVTAGFVDGFYYKPRVDREILEKYHEGLICLSACIQGEVAVNLRKHMYDEAVEAALWHNEVFGQGNYYLEIQDHGLAEQTMVNTDLIRMSKQLGIPLVATNDIHYIRKEDWEAHDVLICIQTSKKVSDEDRMHYEKGKFYLKSAEEMAELFPYAKEALENTNKIAEMCNVEIKFGEQKVPKFDVPEGYEAFDYLKELCQKGLIDRYPDNYEEHQERLNYELDVINSMGFVDYFLIVWDFIRFAKDSGITVGPGRGSAAGSIVAYCLKITNIDPIRDSLIFERFLNPERVTMPDIDVDFGDKKRQEVIEYVVGKYGKANVSQIVTFGTLAPRNCIRDVGRALDIDYSICDLAAKSIPQEKDITIKKALSISPDFKAIYDSDDKLKHLVNIAMQLEGLPRHSSKHAAGVVICSEPLENYVPLSKRADGIVTTQYQAVRLEQLGILKMDFLGIRTITVVQDAIAEIKKNYGISIDTEKIPFDDPAVFELISEGKTEGVFQLESAGMKSFMMELKPHTLEDVIAGISLYRPGPMDFIPQYIAGKENGGKVTYDHPALEKILGPTYGCIVYQEQVMQIVMELAGYSLGRSDVVRSAMSKKKIHVMMEEKEYFVHGNEELGIPGCIKNGIPEETAIKIFDEMAEFAKYAFNKSHAAAYAVVAYQTAYLKAHFPREYMAALISSVKNNKAKVTVYVQHARKLGIKVLPPDVNEGYGDFAVVGDSIRYGLTAIKSVGDAVVARIIEERETNGKFHDLSDFIERLSSKEANKRTIENLIYGGAFDSFKTNRKQMIMVYPELIEQAKRERKSSMTGQFTLFDFSADEGGLAEISKATYPDVEEYDSETKLGFEKDVLGVYVSGHPLSKYESFVEKHVTANTADFAFDEETESTRVYDKVNYSLGGIISSIKITQTKKGDNMAYVSLEDLYGDVEIIVFPRQFNRVRNMLKENNKVFIKGKADVSDDGAKMILDSVETFEDVISIEEAKKKQAWILFENYDDYRNNMELLGRLMKEHVGYTPLCIQLREEYKGWMIGSVNVDEDFIRLVMGMFGKDRIKVIDSEEKTEKS